MYHFYHFTFNCAANLNFLSHNVHWWRRSPCLFCICGLNNNRFRSTLLQIGQLTESSWCRATWVRRFNLFFNLQHFNIYISTTNSITLTEHHKHCIAILVGLLLNVVVPHEFLVSAWFWMYDHIRSKCVWAQAHEHFGRGVIISTLIDSWNQFKNIRLTVYIVC